MLKCARDENQLLAKERVTGLRIMYGQIAFMGKMGSDPASVDDKNRNYDWDDLRRQNARETVRRTTDLVSCFEELQHPNC
jgi:hypothetical protein